MSITAGAQCMLCYFERNMNLAKSLGSEEADVILSKGQGNVETLYGCGYNIYYAFLIKCQLFVKMFGLPKLTPMLLKERK